MLFWFAESVVNNAHVPKECRYHPQKQTSADCDGIVCYGGAKPAEKHLASKMHCVDDEIIEWLQRRRRDRHGAPRPQTP